MTFAIAGCGRIAQRHAIHMQPYGRLVAVCDTVPGKAHALAAEYGCAAFTALEDMLAAGPVPDVVAICTPNGLHAKHSIQCLAAGAHVLCEKPMAITAADCLDMMAMAEQTGRQLFIVKQNRFNPPVAAVKELLSRGGLGAIYSVQLNCFWNRNADYYAGSWKGTLQLDGGTLYTQFSHFIDLLYWFFGDVQQVQAITANSAHKGIIEFEDSGVVTLQFNNGIIGGMHYTVNSYRHNMEGSLTIFGEKGTIKIGGQYLNELEYQCLEGQPITNLPPGNRPNEYGTYTGSMSNHDKVYRNVYDVLLHGAEPYADAYSGYKTVDIIERIYAAVRR